MSDKIYKNEQNVIHLIKPSIILILFIKNNGILVVDNGTILLNAMK